MPLLGFVNICIPFVSFIWDSVLRYILQQQPVRCRSMVVTPGCATYGIFNITSQSLSKGTKCLSKNQDKLYFGKHIAYKMRVYPYFFQGTMLITPSCTTSVTALFITVSQKLFLNLDISSHFLNQVKVCLKEF